MSFRGVLLCVCILCQSGFIWAQTKGAVFDQAYLQWKAEQEAQDQRLKRVDPNYYLARPSVSGSHAAKTTPVTGKISLNQANLEQLQQLHGVGEKKAQAILQYRQQNGAFKSIDELQKVKGIGPKLFERNRERLSL